MDRPIFGRAGSIALGLLLLNVVVLAAGLTMPHWRDQPRALVGYNADKIRVLNEAKAASTEKVATLAVLAAANPSDAAARLQSDVAPSRDAADLSEQTAEPAEQTAEPAKPACFRISLTAATAYAALRQAMEQAGLGGQTLRTEERLGWWVYWPPLNDLASRVQALAAIDRAGVKDAVVIRQGPMVWAISLGMFTSEAGARAQHAALVRRGLTALRYGPRPSIRAVYLDLTSADQDKIAALQAALPDGVGLEAVDCPR